MIGVMLLISDFSSAQGYLSRAVLMFSMLCRKASIVLRKGLNLLLKDPHRVILETAFQSGGLLARHKAIVGRTSDVRRVFYKMLEVGTGKCLPLHVFFYCIYLGKSTKTE